MNLKEELAERHLLASEERSPSCCDWGGVALGDGNDDHGDDHHNDNDDYNDGGDDDDDDYNSDDVGNVVSGDALTRVVMMIPMALVMLMIRINVFGISRPFVKGASFLFSGQNNFLVIRVELWPNAPTDLAIHQTQANVMLNHLHGSVLVSITSILLPLVASSAILLLLHPPVPTLSAPPDTKILPKLIFPYNQVSNWSACQLAYACLRILDLLTKER